MIESRARRLLGHWLPWVAIAWVGVIGVAVYGWTLNARTLRDEAVRVAEAQAERSAAVRQCLANRPELRRLSAHVGGVNDGFQTLIDNSRAALAATPPSDPQYQVRLANLIRLERALKRIAQVSSFPVPTVAECRARGNR